MPEHLFTCVQFFLVCTGAGRQAVGRVVGCLVASLGERLMPSHVCTVDCRCSCRYLTCAVSASHSSLPLRSPSGTRAWHRRYRHPFVCSLHPPRTGPSYDSLLSSTCYAFAHVCTYTYRHVHMSVMKYSCGNARIF